MTTSSALNPHVNEGSRPVLRRSVELATHLGLKIYNRTFRRMDAAQYLAQVITQLQGAASRQYATEIEQVNAAISHEVERLALLVGAETRRLQKHLHAPRAGNKADKDTLAVDYTQPMSVALTMRTPQLRRYADLMATVETTSRTLDIAWYQEQVTTPQRLDLELLLFRNFMRSCTNVERLAWGLARRVQTDTAAPGYRDMVRKRTGRDPIALPAPAVEAEGEAQMTPTEAAHLAATEALAATLLTPLVVVEATATSVTAPPLLTETPSWVDRASEPEAVPAAIDSTDPASTALDSSPTSAATDPPATPPKRRSVRDMAGYGVN